MLDGLDLSFEDGDSDLRSGGGRHRRRKSRLGRSLLTLLIVVAMLGLLGAGGYYGVTKVRAFFTAPDYTGAGYGSVQVQVKPGDAAAEIANTLYDKGVVKSAKAFVDAANSNPNSRNIQPGFYQLAKHMKASLAVTGLLDPSKRVVTKVTIPEGYTTNRILSMLSEKLKLPLSDFQKAAKDPGSLGIPDSWYQRDDGKKANKTVEGFLFPTTYEFDPGTTAQDALTQMVAMFMTQASKAGLDKVSGMSPFEALIVASLGQAEGIPSDFPKITRVVYNRLNDNDQPWLKKLQFDSTTNYWLDLKGKGAKQSSGLTSAELNDPSNPYSTHAHAGLPPGPIDNPSFEAMKAAASPASGNWVYFVRIDKAGHSAFTNDYNKFLDYQALARSRGVL